MISGACSGTIWSLTFCFFAFPAKLGSGLYLFPFSLSLSLWDLLVASSTDVDLAAMDEATPAHSQVMNNGPFVPIPSGRMQLTIYRVARLDGDFPAPPLILQYHWLHVFVPTATGETEAKNHQLKGTVQVKLAQIRKLVLSLLL